jgi:hypothetical protein
VESKSKLLNDKASIKKVVELVWFVSEVVEESHFFFPAIEFV